MNHKINVGLRLFAIALGIATANYLPVMIAFLAPLPTCWPQWLGVASAETEELLSKVKEAAKKEVDEHLKAFNTEGEKKINEIVDKRTEIFKDLPVDKLKKVVDDMDAANKIIAELKEKSRDGAEKKNEEFFITKLKEHWPLMKKNFDAGAGKYGFKLDDTKIDSTAFGAAVIRGFREAGISFAQLPEIFIFDLIQVMTGGPGSNPLTYIERVPVISAGPPPTVEWPTVVAEGAAKPQLGYQWTEGKVSAETIAAIVPVTKQAVFTYPLLEQEIRFELVRRIAYVLQDYILQKILAVAQPFAAGSFAAKVPSANANDVLVVAATQILNNGFVPTDAVVSFNAKGAMTLTKCSDGCYTIPPFMAADGLTVYGLRVHGIKPIGTTFTSDTFLVMDPTRALWNWVEPITIEVGWINDDFAKNMWRLRGEAQGMVRIKAQEYGAFVKGTFAAAIGAIDKPAA